jgi:putative intracellular protease/amidase
MSAHLNVTRPEAPRRILMIAANPAVSPTTGWPVGFWWAELTHPYWAFVEQGYEVEIRSPEGGALVADSFSDPEDASGYSAHDILSLGFKKSPTHAALLADTQSLAGVDVATTTRSSSRAASRPCSPSSTTRGSCTRLVADFYEAGKVVALVCHATCVLLKTRLSTGELLVKGKTWTGFADAEERFADGFVGQRIQPFWIESEARKLGAPTSSSTSPLPPVRRARRAAGDRAAAVLRRRSRPARDRGPGALSHIGRYRSSERAERTFCTHCGSRLAKEPVGAARVMISVGLFPADLPRRIRKHVFEHSKPAWYDLPAVEEMP